MGPLPVMAACFAAGLAASGLLLPLLPFPLLLAAAGAAAASASWLWIRRVRYASAAVLLACALSGLLSGTRMPPSTLPNEAIEALESGKAVLEAAVTSPGRRTEFGLAFEARPLRLLSHSGMPLFPDAAMPARLRIIMTCGERPEGLDEGAGMLLKQPERLKTSLAGLRNPDAPEPKRVKGTGLKVKERNLLVIPGKPQGLALLRNRLSLKLGAALSPESALFSEAVTLGRPGRMPVEISDAFRRSGLAHLLAVSGLHLSVLSILVVTLLTALLSRIPFVASRVPAAWVAALGSIPLIWAYALFASARPPVLRAALMVTACFLAHLTGRRSTLPSALALAALFVLTTDPAVLMGPSFILSFSAVAGIFLFSKRISGILFHRVMRFQHEVPRDGGILRRGLRRICGFFADLAAVSAAASLATLPALCLFFGSVPLSGIACNLAAVPIFSFLVLPANLLFAAALLAGARLPAAAALLVDRVNILFLRLVTGLSGLVDPLPIEPWAAWPTALLVTAALVLAGARKRAAALLLTIPLGLVLFLPPLYARVRRHLVTRENLTVIFSDVGQGDSILVRTPEGRHLLVDAGPGPGDRFARWLGTWTRLIDLFVITHGHGDHYGGASALLREGIHVTNLWINPQGLEERDDPGYIALIEAFKKSGAALTAGPPCGLSSLGSLRIGVLAPCGPEGYDYLLDWNNNSIVLHLAYGGAGFLLTGDLEEEGEKRLAHRSGFEAAVIKVPHHGSPGSSSGIITSWPGSRIAVITAGLNNAFGFPHPRVLSDFKKEGIHIFRVDRDGAVVMITDGSSLGVRDYKWKEKMRLKLP